MAIEPEVLVTVGTPLPSLAIMVSNSAFRVKSGSLNDARQSVSPAVMRRVMRELAEMKKNPPEGIRVQTNEQDMMDITGIIQGPGEHIPRLLQWL